MDVEEFLASQPKYLLYTGNSSLLMLLGIKLCL